MSRTDAHRPAWVQINDYPEHATARHDHRFGACDLPAPADTGAAAGACHRDLPYWAAGTCGCAVCTGAPWRRAANRRTRSAGRAWARAARRGADPAELEAHEGRVGAVQRSWW